jgi:plastocyanin
MRGIRALAITTIVGTLGLALGAAATPADNDASESLRKRVVVRDNFFEPRSVNIHKGDRVAWVWRGENPHNVTFVKVPKGAGKRGAETRTTGRWSRVFRKRGLYKYVCTIHAGMKGTIDVDYQQSLIPPTTTP